MTQGNSQACCVTLMILLNLGSSVICRQLYIQIEGEYVELPGNFVVTLPGDTESIPAGRHILVQHLIDQERGSRPKLENGTLAFGGKSMTVDYYDTLALYNLYLTQPAFQEELFGTQQAQTSCQQQIAMSSIGRCVGVPGRFHACVSSGSMDVDIRDGNCVADEV